MNPRDGDGVPNAVEVANLTNPFDPQDVDPRPYIWLKNGQIVEGSIDEGDIGHLTTLVYHIKAQSNCPPIMVRVAEGGYVVESFFATCSAPMIHLNPGEYPATNRVFCIIPNGRTNFMFRVADGGTVWENENPAEYGADIVLTHAPAILDLDAGVSEASEETVGFLLASKNAHDGAQRRALSIQGPENTWGYASNIVLTYDTARLRIYDEEDNVLSSGTQFYEEDYIPALEVEGLAHSGAMRDAWINVAATGVPVSDRVNATVLKADIGTVQPLADRTLHPDAARQPLTLKQTLPSGWNGLMELSWSGAVACWTPTGGTPIVSGSVFSNALLPQIIYLEGDGCGTNEAVFSVVGLSDCKTNLALSIFGMNATLAGVAELDEESPGGFIADRAKQAALVEQQKARLAELGTLQERLLDVFLAGDIEREEFTARKERYVQEKVALADAVAKFEAQGVSRLEPVIEFLRASRQAKYDAQTENPEDLRIFYKKVEWNLIFAVRNLAAERGAPQAAPPPDGCGSQGGSEGLPPPDPRASRRLCRTLPPCGGQAGLPESSP